MLKVNRCNMSEEQHNIRFVWLDNKCDLSVQEHLYRALELLERKGSKG